MKIRCEVLAVESTGDAIRVRWQGRGVKDADWRPYMSGTIEVAHTKTSERAYHVGRVFTMEVCVQ